jgi:outer membrane protein, heavy metal efflux system
MQYLLLGASDPKDEGFSMAARSEPVFSLWVFPLVWAAAFSAAALLCGGCRSPGQVAEMQPVSEPVVTGALETATSESLSQTQFVSLEQPATESDDIPPGGSELYFSDRGPRTAASETLSLLEALALQSNPTLRRMQQEAAAAWARANYVARLPDPTLGSTFFVPPMHFEPDRQLADLQYMQMIPWLGRLKAEARRACLEAMVAENQYRAERLRVIGDLRAGWYELYVLGKQIEITQAEQAQLEALIRTANARVATGDTQPGDVLMATLELSSLQEQLISYRRQVTATSAELNRLAGRVSEAEIDLPTEIDKDFPEWDHSLLRQVAFASQPELHAAQLQTAATRWGIEVARLRRRPDLTFGVGWVFMDAPGAMMPEAGKDSLTLGVTTTLPVSKGKYNAIAAEASREHLAAHATEDEVAARLDATLQDLWAQALASRNTVELYEASILPQARQTFEANQQALVNNTVTFDRVVRDYRTLLGLELGYHRALGQQATALARIQQTIGVDQPVVPSGNSLSDP